MNPNKSLWEKGDFTRIAQSMRERGEDLVKDGISFEKDTYTFNYPGSPSELLAQFKGYYGPTMNAFEAAAKEGREDDLEAELESLFEEQNTSDDATVIPATFLRVTVGR